MGTRSIIAVVGHEGAVINGTEFKLSSNNWYGRYCHYDGYPSHMVPTLQAIIKKYGVAEAKSKLLANSWTVLGLKEGSPMDFDTTDEIGEHSDYNNDPFLLQGSDDWGTEYLYIINDNGSIDVKTPEMDNNERLATVQLTDGIVKELANL